MQLYMVTCNDKEFYSTINSVQATNIANTFHGWVYMIDTITKTVIVAYIYPSIKRIIMAPCFDWLHSQII